MPRRSAGLLLFRRGAGKLELFLVHPGGPFWARKDLGAWSIPKGEYTEGEDPFAAACRELQEETGCTAAGTFLALGTVKQPGGKLVTAWAVEGECAPATLISNTFRMEYPPRSGKWVTVPEVDRAEWFSPEAAREHILQGQAPLIDRLLEQLQK